MTWHAKFSKHINDWISFKETDVHHTLKLRSHCKRTGEGEPRRGEAKRSGKAETTSEFPVSKWLIYDHKHGITMFLVENSFLKLVNKQQQRPLILDMDS